ncbi:T9SS type B sorting domain-containing protein [Lacinutrix sp. MedPE-SW]|uniref:T9SS type B sorting domain-containing protein n=1 Tax=Lacinutrix sp. MedPE-SW TaxID=1860087 RepID=UPI00091585D4|nr:T9SS type B sorting domain-containing protein [Lacinutrix sp. MedPE-SW]OIQ19388.1 MAG: hypothetical protein BM549_10615 [Lacinutrix sp. MedPE-SW]
MNKSSKNPVNYIVCIVLIVSFFKLNAQQINVDGTQTPQNLIENNLVQGCVQVSNISSPINGSINGFSSFGYFERANSNFPFENGIVLSSGNINSVGNSQNTNALNEGNTNWQTDPDLENALGINNTLNATTIQFSFISGSSSIQFNYILASEEYFADYPCNYSDGFAFLIRETGSGNPYQNIAIVPGTSTPVNTSTIHDEIVGFCPAENESYFEGYNIGDTNFNGRTTVMSASANITPNTQYDIKLIIADQTDRNFDSAVFIEGNSFTDSVDLGPDFSTCDASTVLNANTNNPQATYVWYQNNTIINGENSSSLNVNTSATYTVEITVPLNNTSCTFEDSIDVTLNSIQNISPLNDFELCDDISNDQTENFDLTTRNNEMLSLLPNSNYSISYHASSQSASNNTNAFTNINNVTNPQTVYIRAEDTSSGCVYISQVSLIVNPTPEITDPEDAEICSNSDGSIALTNFNNEITNNNSNYSVTYHFSQTDADSGANPIASPYTPTNTTEQLFIRVININTGCLAFTDITINTYDAPDVDTTTQQINACEQDDDGFETFDLESVLPNVLQGVTNVTTTFHTSIEDAQSDINAINNTTNFQNTEPDFQIVYIRIENNNNSCFEIVAIELHTNILETGTNIRDFSVCDNAPDDNIGEFNLENITTTIANGLPDVEITYYETEEDLTNNTNAIDASTLYSVNNTQTLYILIEDADCSNTSEIVLNILPSVTILNDAPVTYCDTDPDGFTSIQLSSFNSLMSEGIPNAAVTYYETQTDADNYENQLPEFYNNTVNPVTVYVRVIGEGGCHDIKPLQIEVLPAPDTVIPSGFLICDDDQDGIYNIDLTSKNTEITNNNNVSISYFETENDANSSTNQIINDTNYAAQTNTVFAKVSNNDTGCYALVPVDIIINTLPVFTSIPDFRLCETDGNQTADFIFSLHDDNVLNGQTGKQVLYFETQVDATNRTNIIDKNAVYNNTSQTQTMFVRVENITDSSCFGVSNFNIEVGSDPIYTEPQDVFVCDDISNDGFETFNLNEITNTITQGSPDTLTVSYYLSQNDADNEINALPQSFTTTENPQAIFVVVDNGTYCKGFNSFEFNVIQVPQINPASNLEVCDTNTDGFAAFDLTIAEIEVLAVRQDNISIAYYENINDLETNNNPIANPENYTNTSNPQTVYIEITNTVSNCEVSVPIELIVNLPPVINNIGSYNTCDNENNTFNLNETIDTLINNQNAIVNFFSSQADAETNQNALNTDYTYTSNNETIYARAEFSNNGCYNIMPFTLVVNALPIANSPQDLEACDDDYDSFLFFDLSQQTATILGNQNQNDFTVTYYNTLADANSASNPIQNLNYEAENGEQFFARIENNTTSCYSTTSFLTIVRRKPNVEITNQVICLDNLPLTVTAETFVDTDTYLWSTGETTSIIDIDSIGNYSVTVTTQYGCSTTSNFEVSESEAAIIEFTETIDFGNPNNLTITVSGIGEYLYQFDDGEPQESNFFGNVPIGPHTITVIDVNGCNSTTKEIVIIDAPQYFTPNGDGINETWHITGVELLEGTIVNVYNRYGKLLGTLNHFSNGWDGNYNGNPMPATDYWFVADVKKGNIEFQVKGHFALKR